MNRETEYIARQLAGLVLRDDPASASGGPEQAGCGEVRVDVEMRGMVRTIRQSLLVDGAKIAGTIADEIERQVAAVDLDAIIATKVAQAVASERASLDRLVADAVHSIVRERVTAAAEVAARDIGTQAAEALVATALGGERKSRKARRR